MTLKSPTPANLFFVFICAALLPFNTSALGIVTSAEQLKEKAELVIVGKIKTKTGQEMKLNEQIPDGSQKPEKFSAIMTKYDIEIDKVLKGSHETNTISVYSFGGQDGEYIERWSFGFDLNVSDEVLLFLQKSKANYIWMAVQHSQGVFRLISTDGTWRLISMNSDHVVSPDSEISSQDYQDQAIESLENYINENKQ
jgi:hypothetical protein